MAEKVIEAETSDKISKSNEGSSRSRPVNHKNDLVVNFETRFDEILQTFYASAFSLLVYKRGLCPKQGFKVETKLGIQIPWFVHPSSVDYVNEVSEKIVFFMRKNILEGAVLHVMILKDKKPHAIQRFVFRPNGGFELDEREQLNSVSSEERLESVKNQFVSCLLDIRKSEMAEIECPWFCRWSVSIGMKKEFLSMCRGVGPKGPFTHDPNRVYFPWKKRVRQGRKTTKGSILRMKPSFRSQLAKISGLEKVCNVERKVEIKAPGSPDMFANDDDAESVGSIDVDMDASVSNSSKETDSQDWITSPSSSTLDQMDYLFSSEEDCDTDGTDVGDQNIKTMHPISSFPIIGGLMMNVYSIDYPFDIDDEMIRASKKGEERSQPDYNDLY